MKKKILKIIVLLIAILLLSLLILFLYNNSKITTYKFIMDSTSSGATRIYNAEISFKNGKVKSGYELTFIGQGGGCQSDCDSTKACIINDGNWINSLSSNREICDSNIPTNEKGLNKYILDNEIKKIKASEICTHYDMCYTLEK